MRLVQYYFGTRSGLLVEALKILNVEAEGQARQRISQGSHATAEDVVLQVLMELLPLDDQRRLRHTVYAAYFVRLLHDQDLAQAAGQAASSLDETLSALLQQLMGGQYAGSELVRAEAELLEAVASGLQARMLLGDLDGSRAIELLHHQVRRAFDAIARAQT